MSEVNAKWDTKDAARKYNQKNRGTRKDRREKACIAKLLRHTPQGKSVLDLPCGTGRLTTFLTNLGYTVTAADCSEHMLDFARESFKGCRFRSTQSSLGSCCASQRFVCMPEAFPTL